MKIAVIGLGNMGASHVKDLSSIDGVELTAVCDVVAQKADEFSEKFSTKAYYSYQSLINEAPPDAVVIATPHYSHAPIAVECLSKGIHVLTEKPIAVHVNDAKKMIRAYETAKKNFPDLVFAAMFQQRTHGYWRKIKELIECGELGKLIRMTWIITDWFRTQYYYDTGEWRATWKGEGGGVLLNQCPHNLDLFQWFAGLPKSVYGFVSIGKYHDIEVEDEVTGYFEYENGMVGHFITTTAESPGTNRLEIVGEYGKLIFESEQLTFYRNRESMLDTIRNSPKAFTKVENWRIDIPYEPDVITPHCQVLLNFIDVINNQGKLIAPAIEGIYSVSLGNAILLSSILSEPVQLPLDGDLYQKELDKLIQKSNRKKNVVDGENIDDFSKSF